MKRGGGGGLSANNGEAELRRTGTVMVGRSTKTQRQTGRGMWHVMFMYIRMYASHATYCTTKYCGVELERTAKLRGVRVRHGEGAW